MLALLQRYGIDTALGSDKIFPTLDAALTEYKHLPTRGTS